MADQDRDRKSVEQETDIGLPAEESASFSRDETPPPPVDTDFAPPTHNDAPPTVQPGSGSTMFDSSREYPILAGYTVERVLGRGGMGVVYLARQHSPSRDVAIKMLHVNDEVRSELVQRFQNEASTIAGLQHPNIVQIYELGKTSSRPWFSMEYVEGQTLNELMRSRTFSPSEAAAVMETVARAMAYAHEHGVIHRDMKPGNVLVTPTGTIKITDFGLAKQLNTEADLTRTGVVMGTPSYMSPEQAAGKTRTIGPPTDLFALGVMLYELLTSKRPFEGESHLEVMEKVRNVEPVSPRLLNAGIPRDLETICLKCLRKQPESRYASAAELAEDLRRFQQGLPIHGRRPTLRERLKSEWRSRPRRLAGVGLAILLCLGILGGLFSWYAYAKEHVAYYRYVTFEYEVPKGVYELTPEQVSHRGLSYKLTRKGLWGPVLRMELVNGHGELSWYKGVIPALGETDTEWGGLYSVRLEYISDQVEGEPRTKTKAYDRSGHHLWTFVFTTPTTGYYLDRHGRPLVRSKAGATTIHFEFDDNGYARKITYYDLFSDQPKPNQDGSYGELREIDDRGIVVRQTNLGPGGMPDYHPNGHMHKENVYSEEGLLLKERLLDENNELTLHKDGYAQAVYEYDEWGNYTTITWMNTRDELMNTGSGYSIEKSAYDEFGNLIEYRLLDSEGKPVHNANGVAVARYEYESHGWPVWERYYNHKFEPTESVKGMHALKHEYDDKGQEIRTSFYNIDGGLTYHAEDGESVIERKYDDQGNIVEEDYFGPDLQPILTRSGFSRWTASYDRNGNQIEERNFGPDGSLVLSTENYAILKGTYNSRGHLLEQIYLGTNGEPVMHSNGFHRSVHEYDDQGRKTVMSLYDPEGKPVAHQQGHARIRSYYDAPGNLIREEYYGVNDQLVYTTDGYAIWTAEYDRRRNHTRTVVFGPNKERINSTLGYCEERLVYNDRNDLIEIEFFDAEGKTPPRIRFPHLFDSCWAMNAKGYRWLPNPGDPVWNWKLEFNPGSGETVALVFQDDEYFGQLLGVRSVLLQRDDQQRIQSFQFLNENDEVVPLGEVAYNLGRSNNQGKFIERRYYNQQGELVMGWRGVAIERFGWNPRGSQISWEGLGPDERPSDKAFGIASWTTEFDSRGNQIERWGYRADGQLGAWANGCSGWKAKYDHLNRQTESTYYGKNRKPINIDRGFCIWRGEYNSRGDLIDEEFFDTTEKPVEMRVVITNILPASNAARSGILPGDLMLSYHGKRGSRPFYLQLIKEVNEQLKGDEKVKVPVEIEREGKVLTLRVDPGPLGVFWESHAVSILKPQPEPERNPVEAPVPMLSE